MSTGAPLNIRPIQQSDSDSLKGLILNGVLDNVEDDSLNDLYTTYSESRSCYFVVTCNGVLMGGAGLRPLNGASQKTCELQQIYLNPNLNQSTYGVDIGKALLDRCFHEASTLNGCVA